MMRVALLAAVVANDFQWTLPQQMVFAATVVACPGRPLLLHLHCTCFAAHVVCVPFLPADGAHHLVGAFPQHVLLAPTIVAGLVGPLLTFLVHSVPTDVLRVAASVAVLADDLLRAVSEGVLKAAAVLAAPRRRWALHDFNDVVMAQCQRRVAIRDLIVDGLQLPLGIKLPAVHRRGPGFILEVLNLRGQHDVPQRLFRVLPVPIVRPWSDIRALRSIWARATHVILRAADRTEHLMRTLVQRVIPLPTIVTAHFILWIALHPFANRLVHRAFVCRVPSVSTTRA